MADILPNDDNPDWSEFTPAPLDYAAKLKATRARLSMSQDNFQRSFISHARPCKTGSSAGQSRMRSPGP